MKMLFLAQVLVDKCYVFVSRLITSGIWEFNGRLIDGLQMGRGVLHFRLNGAGFGSLLNVLCFVIFVLGKIWVYKDIQRISWNA
jgi:hypothetical protein